MPEFRCHVCTTLLTADAQYVGQLMRCPTCRTTLRVPSEAAAVGAGAVATPPGRPTPGNAMGVAHRENAPTMISRTPMFKGVGKRYGFNCPYCSSRLEANESMAAQDGQCPTCGNNITIPILDRYGRLIDPKTRQIIKQDPHPVHAYAAAGDRAPKILKSAQGQQTIRCPRCAALSPVTANNCKACGMPFTMEGTTLEASGNSNGFCVASLVLGIISLPTGCIVITPLLAIIFGIIGYTQTTKEGAEGGGKGMAIAGIVCAVIGGVVGATQTWLK